MHRQQRQSAETNPQREVGRGDGRAYHSRWAEGDRGEEGRCFSSPLAALRVAWWWWREGGGAAVVFVRGSRVGWTRASPPRHLFGRKAATDRGPTSQCLPLVLLDQPHDESLLVGYWRLWAPGITSRRHIVEFTD